LGNVVELLLDNIVKDCDAVPLAWLSHLPFLRTIRLTHAGCETLPELSYRAGRHYRTVVLDHNDLTTRLPVGWFTALPNVRTLHLADNFLTGSLSSDLGRLRAIKGLDLHSNRFSGTIPDVFDQLKSIAHVLLNDNRFVGGIPPSLFQIGGIFVNQTYRNIAHVNVGENRLTGTIPPLSPNLWNTLRLNYNQLTGTLPPSLVDQRDMVELDVSSNRLTGSLSAGFGQWQKAIRLKFSNNGFWGKLPEEMGRLPLLEELTLDRNVFDGSVPDAWCQRGDRWGLTSIEYLQADCLAESDMTNVDDKSTQPSNPLPNIEKSTTVAETPCACCNICCNSRTGECRNTIHRDNSA
jgi:hypothetical protein